MQYTSVTSVTLTLTDRYVTELAFFRRGKGDREKMAGFRIIVLQGVIVVNRKTPDRFDKCNPLSATKPQPPPRLVYGTPTRPRRTRDDDGVP